MVSATAPIACYSFAISRSCATQTRAKKARLHERRDVLFYSKKRVCVPESSANARELLTKKVQAQKMKLHCVVENALKGAIAGRTGTCSSFERLEQQRFKGERLLERAEELEPRTTASA